MACGSCGKGQAIKVNRPVSRQTTLLKISPQPRRLGSRKPGASVAVVTKPANDLDKYRV